MGTRTSMTQRNQELRLVHIKVGNRVGHNRRKGRFLVVGWRGNWAKLMANKPKVESKTNYTYSKKKIEPKYVHGHKGLMMKEHDIIQVKPFTS